MNKDIKYALEYHQETKHSEVSIRSSNHYLDWDNKPKPFKFYTSLPSEALPVDFPIPSLNVITMKDTSQIPFPIDTKINIKLLASLLFFRRELLGKSSIRLEVILCVLHLPLVPYIQLNCI